MNIGIFTTPASYTVLAVMDYESYMGEIIARGYHLQPIISRPATTPEIVAYEERKQSFPAWEYSNYDELLDDEEMGGASREYLATLMGMLEQITDPEPMPGPTGSLILSLQDDFS